MTLRLTFLLTASVACLLAQESTGALQVRVTDPSGAAIPGADVSLVNGNDSIRAATTDVSGQVRLNGLPAGSYTVRVACANFVPVERKGVAVIGGRTQSLSVGLAIQGQTSRVTVSDSSGLSVDPTQNAGQLVLKGSDLDAFSDDAEDLSNELQMLAGPAAGPDGGQIYIDGFSGGRMPPKQSIREIRVNQNPFSSEYDRPGFGRVEVFTKPGADSYHGQASFDFANRALTARNPYLVGPVVPNYRQEFFSGNISGPLSKKASFFADVDRRMTDENSLLNYTDLDAGLRPVLVSGAVVAPSRRFSTSPRLDYSLNPNDTLTLRYSFQETSAKNQGLTSQGFDQPSRAYGSDTTEQSVQVANSVVLGHNAENDTRFQFFRTRTNLRGLSTAPEIDVQGAFTGGGTFALNYTDRNRYEFQDMAMLLRGKHTIKIGGRVRDDRLEQRSETNFNGRFIFTAQPGLQAIDVYRQNRILAAQGVSQTAIAAAGFGPSEFLLTAGRPVTSVDLFDFGAFVQDDWRVKPNLSISGGLRLESQNAVADHRDFAPRVGLAWAPAKGASSPRTVFRAGAGIFYDRFTADLLLNAQQLNGINQTQILVRNPTFYPLIPDPASLTGLQVRTIRQVDSRFDAPYLIQTAFGIERQLPRNVSLAVNYAYTRGLRQLRTRDINAPYPTVFDTFGRSIGPRPFGNSAGDVYEYEAAGSYRQHQLIVSVTGRISRRISAYGYYVYGRATSDTDGAGTQPANPYDLRSEYGRAAYDNRHRGFLSTTVNLPLRIRMAPFLFLQSGRPYNITSGVDAKWRRESQ